MVWIPRCCSPPPCNSSTPGTSPMWNSAIPTRVGGSRASRLDTGPAPVSTVPRRDAGRRLASGHDTMERTWRHLNFFWYEAFTHASVPRVACPEHGGGLRRCRGRVRAAGSCSCSGRWSWNRRKASRSRTSPNRSAGTTRDRGGSSAITCRRRACGLATVCWTVS